MIFEIALGIVLGAIILALLPLILVGSVYLAIAAVVIGVAVWIFSTIGLATGLTGEQVFWHFVFGLWGIFAIIAIFRGIWWIFQKTQYVVAWIRS